MKVSENISLRAPEPSDAHTIYIWENDETLWPDGIIKQPVSEYAVLQFITGASYNPFAEGQLRLIATDENRQSIGMVDLYDISATNSCARIAIFIDPSYRNRGVGTAVLKKMCDYAGSGCLNLHTLGAEVSADNLPSKEMFGKCGFKVCGCLRSWLKTGNRHHDMLIFQKMLQ